MSKTWNAGRARRLAGQAAKTVLPRRVVRWLQRLRSEPLVQTSIEEPPRVVRPTAVTKPLILMYHRIAEDPVDYWGLSVSPAHFIEHLSVLRRTRRPLPLAEFVRRLVHGTLPPDAVTLTFDDGYVDNLAAGLPLLEAADVPATVFLATGFLDHLEPFWWDELANRVLLEKGPKRIEIAIGGTPIAINLGDDACARKDGAVAAPSNSRRQALETIYHPLRRLHEAERGAVMNRLRSLLPGLPGEPTRLGRPMTSGEVRALVAGGLVSIGAHTVTHPLMPELDSTACRHELAASKRTCEALAGSPIAAFAYPFGEYNAATCEIVQNAGFAFACSTGRAPTVAASDLFALRRIYITNLNGDAFEQRLRAA